MATSKELLTNLADELRTLTNTTDKMGLSVMAGHVSDANTEVDEQSAVVDELMAALQGKSVPGGSSGTSTYETCTVTLTSGDTGYAVMYYTLEDNEPVCKTIFDGMSNFNYTIEPIVGSYIVFGCAGCIAPLYITLSGTGSYASLSSKTIPLNTWGVTIQITGDGTIYMRQ